MKQKSFLDRSTTISKQTINSSSMKSSQKNCIMCSFFDTMHASCNILIQKHSSMLSQQLNLVHALMCARKKSTKKGISKGCVTYRSKSLHSASENSKTFPFCIFTARVARERSLLVSYSFSIIQQYSSSHLMAGTMR